MDNAGKGCGRGAALVDALLKAQKKDTSDKKPASDSLPPGPGLSPGLLPTPPTLPNSSKEVKELSTPKLPIGGRGHILMMFRKLERKPGEPICLTNSNRAATSVHGIGRGIRALQLLAAHEKSMAAAAAMQADVFAVTKQVQDVSIEQGRINSKVKGTPPVVRKGESGAPCLVTANFIRLNFKENTVFEYLVKYNPDQNYKHLRNKLLYEHSDILKENMFNGTVLYLSHKLPDEITKLTSKNPNDQTLVELSIIFKGTHQLSEMIHILNVLFKKIMCDLQFTRVGSGYYSDNAAVLIPQHQLKVWPGYTTAVDEYEGGLMLTLDSTHRLVWPQSVLNIINLIVQNERTKWIQKIESMLVGSIVMSSYNKKTYRVDSVVFDQSPKSTFEKPVNGEMVKISYIDYYKSTYGINIKDCDQPLLISRKTKRSLGKDEPQEYKLICLVPELCQMTGFSDEQLSDFHLMKDVATYTLMTPDQRHAAFKQFINNVMSNEQACKRLSGWGLSFTPETIVLIARRLTPETLFFGNNVMVMGKPNAEWNKEIAMNPVMHAVDITHWVLMYPQTEEVVAQVFLNTILHCSRAMGITMKPPMIVVLQSDTTFAYVEALTNCFNNPLQVVVTICPNAQPNRYAAIKKICLVKNSVLSQVVISRTLKNSATVRTIITKIALQINCKLGGTLWNVSIPIKSCMVIGIDCYHDPKMKNKGVCAFVASVDDKFTRWYSRAVFQNCQQDIVDSLEYCFVESLSHYLKINGNLPERIIVYRSSVGEDQLKILSKYEIPQLLVKIKSVFTKYKPSLTYIVVQKKTHTKIFVKLNGVFENPAPGTVVDHDITTRDWYDFIILSQKVNRGTATPSRYVVVHDDSDMSTDHCQRLTYKLCHLYYNWPGTVCMPAPCLYAHKLATLVGHVIHHLPSESLTDKLFYL